MNKNQFPFWLIVLFVFAALILPSLVKDGMFMDGLFYACVAKNMSQGIGSFWFPHFSKTLHSFYFHNPSLGIGIQSLFFSVLGDGMYVERIYSFFTAIIALLLIVFLWKIIFPGEKNIKDISWLPVLFWIIIPVCFWSYSNNMLENTMVIFDLSAIIFIALFLFQKQNVIYLLVSIIFIFCASLTKGFQGMFPLSALFFGWLFLRKISFPKMILFSLVVVLGLFFLFFILFQYEDARISLTKYLNERVFNSIMNVSNVENRFYIIYRLLLELLPPIVLTIILVILYKIKRTNTEPALNSYLRYSFFFISIGISASLPLMITHEQKGFYLVTSFPYFAIAIATFIAPNIIFLLGKINIQSIQFKFFRAVSILLLAGVIAYSCFQIGETGRDEEMLRDVHLIGKVVPRGTVLGSTIELWQDWPLQEYLIRHYYICQGSNISADNDYILVDSPEKIPQELKVEKVNIPTVKYNLYKVIK